MSRIPDCRTDEAYNQKYLNKRDKAELFGFDYCTEAAVDNFFENIDDIFPKDSYLGHVLNEELPEDMQEEYEMEFSFRLGVDEPASEKRICKTYADLFRMALLEDIENVRDEVITSMIDNMSDEEYEAIKAKVDGNE